ncbi:hypothetical protein [Geomonas propionica]|uniref:DNA polymerase III subunit beta n=1 Tax=Geomonas propionica TaxID=2798582 RepID=A0ABS0YPR1_9BACT|nr:hypothetical protein [Geomonas propionica]MBJ6799757.1 hypothetical protein [Geomonas propionica]
MSFKVTVDRKAFRGVLLSLRKLTKVKKPFEVVLSYNGGMLLVHSVGGSMPVVADGCATVDVHLPGGPFFNLAEVLPEVSPLTLEYSGEVLQLDTLRLPCTTSVSRPFLVQLPLNPRTVDILSLRYQHSVNEISRSGYARMFVEAERERETLIKKAARILGPLGVTGEDLFALVEGRLKKHAQR